MGRPQRSAVAAALALFAALHLGQSRADLFGFRLGDGDLVARVADPDPSVRLRAFERIAERRLTAAAPAAAARLSAETDPVVRAAICATLGLLGEPIATRPLADVARLRGDASRRAATLALGGIRDDGAIDALVALLSDAEVRAAAQQALGRQGARALRRLLWIADNPQLGPNAIAALGRLGDLRATPTLIAALRSPRGPIRRAAATALGELAPPGIDRWLDAAAEDGDREVALAARHALARLAGAPIAPLEAGGGGDVEWGAPGRGRDAGAMRRAAARAFDSRTDPLARARAIRILGVWAHPAPLLGPAAGLDGPTVRRLSTLASGAAAPAVLRAAALFALGAAADGRALESAAIGLRSADAAIRREAARAAGRRGGGAAASLLVEALDRERDRTVRATIALALADVGPALAEARSRLTALLFGADIPVQINALRALGAAALLARTAPDRAEIDVVTALLSSDDASVRANAAWALEALGARHSDLVLADAYLAESVPFVRAALASVLERLATPRAFETTDVVTRTNVESSAGARAGSTAARGVDFFDAHVVDEHGLAHAGTEFRLALPGRWIIAGWTGPGGEVTELDLVRGPCDLKVLAGP